MPVCDQCDVAYLPGEHHACVVKRTGRTSFAVLAVMVLIIGLSFMLWGYAVQISPDGRVWRPFLASVLVMPLGVVFTGVGLIALLMFLAARVRDRLW